MSGTHASSSTPLRIRNLNYAAGFAAWMFLIGLSLMVMVLGGIFFGDKGVALLKDPFPFVVFAIASGALYAGFVFPVYWIEIGDSLTYRKIFKTYSVPWSGVKRVSLEREVSKIGGTYGLSLPIGQHEIAIIELVKGARIKIKIEHEDISAVEALFRLTGHRKDA